jgi:AraC-like DNA-binding protein
VLSKVEVEDCRHFLATPTQLIAYHFIIAGKLLVGVEGEPSIEVRAGEIVLLPRNDAHTLASASGLKPVKGRDLVQPSPDGGLARVLHGGGGEPVHMVCGFLGSEELYNPLIAALPRILKLDIRKGASRDWIEASVRFAAGELTEGRLASSGVLSRLSELLFIEAVREYFSSLGDQETGWLRGLADPQVGRALALIHRQTNAPWSAEALAKEVALSRSAFVDRFTTLVGVPPIRYLTVWRLQTAKLNLRETRASIAQLAHSVGYESEEAFSRAFKREYGLPPARWRDQQSLN